MTGEAARAGAAARIGAATLAVLALCGAPGADAQAPVATVLIEQYRFVPAEVTVKAGTIVRWENAEKRASHSILFTGPGGVESERLFPGERYERRFDAPGRHPYTCGPHPEMTGIVVVLP